MQANWIWKSEIGRLADNLALTLSRRKKVTFKKLLCKNAAYEYLRLVWLMSPAMVEEFSEEYSALGFVFSDSLKSTATGLATYVADHNADIQQLSNTEKESELNSLKVSYGRIGKAAEEFGLISRKRSGAGKELIIHAHPLLHDLMTNFHAQIGAFYEQPKN